MVCDDPFCATHWAELHRRGKRSAHPFCPIDDEGRLTYDAVTADGAAAGRFLGFGPQERGGDAGDAGAGEGTAGGGSAGGSAGGGGDLAAAGPGAWEKFEDGDGNWYWFNHETGESTYVDPSGSPSGDPSGPGHGSGAAAAAAVVASGGDWEQFEDDQGNAYWHNSSTGDSTYDDPYAAAT